jgi:hypothetical protein
MSQKTLILNSLFIQFQGAMLHLRSLILQTRKCIKGIRGKCVIRTIFNGLWFDMIYIQMVVSFLFHHQDSSIEKTQLLELQTTGEPIY